MSTSLGESEERRRGGVARLLRGHGMIDSNGCAGSGSLGLGGPAAGGRWRRPGEEDGREERRGKKGNQKTDADRRTWNEIYFWRHAPTRHTLSPGRETDVDTDGRERATRAHAVDAHTHTHRSVSRSVGRRSGSQSVTRTYRYSYTYSYSATLNLHLCLSRALLPTCRFHPTEKKSGTAVACTRGHLARQSSLPGDAVESAPPPSGDD